MKFRIYRYNPDMDAAPYMQDYELDIRHDDSTEGKMLLDALLLIKEQDDSLSLRKSCREGVCGSDAMNINGRNGLGMHHAAAYASRSRSNCGRCRACR